MMSVSLSVVIVENHDGGDNTACHHEHDAVEIGAWKLKICRFNIIEESSVPSDTRGEDRPDYLSRKKFGIPGKV